MQKAPKCLNQQAFTLIELMMALVVMGLALTAVTISFRSKWDAEPAKRNAQKVVNLWLKARSQAWKEGRDWIVEWNKEKGVLEARPYISREESESKNNTPPKFTTEIDKEIRIEAAGQYENTSTSAFFFGNGRAREANILVSKDKNEIWNVKTDWTGYPMMERIHNLSETKTYKGSPRWNSVTKSSSNS